MLTSEVATGTGDAEPEVAGNEMIKRRLFNGADIDHCRLTIGQST